MVGLPKIQSSHPKFPGHYQESIWKQTFKDVIFGMEDGMVSTFGVVTGIALAAQSQVAVLLSGIVVIAVESLSMGVGSYISNKAERDMHGGLLAEERLEHKEFPQEEQAELVELYLRDGWPEKLAQEMSATAFKNKKLFLKEMAYRELGIIQKAADNPIKNGVFMFVAYVLGGLIPLLPYFIWPIKISVSWSILLSLVGLFVLGVVVAKYTKRAWWRSGLELLILAGLSGLVGYLAGQVVVN